MAATTSEPTFSYDEVPKNFIHCFAQCPASGTCLRAIAGRMADCPVVYALAPLPLTERSTDCPQYISKDPVSYGRGMKNFLSSVTLGQHKSIVAGLTRIFHSQRQYYRALNGDILIPLAVQQKIDALAVSHGLPTPVAYDSTEEHLEWFPYIDY